MAVSWGQGIWMEVTPMLRTAVETPGGNVGSLGKVSTLSMDEDPGTDPPASESHISDGTEAHMLKTK